MTISQLYALSSDQWGSFSDSAQTALQTLWGSADLETISGGVISA